MSESKVKSWGCFKPGNMSYVKFIRADIKGTPQSSGHYKRSFELLMFSHLIYPI